MPAYCVSRKLQRFIVALVLYRFIFVWIGWYQAKQQLLQRVVYALHAGRHRTWM